MPSNFPAWSSVTCTDADTEYELTIPKGTKQFSISTNHASAIIRVSTVTGQVATPTGLYYAIPNGKEYHVADLELTADVVFYVASDVATAIAIAHYWS